MSSAASFPLCRGHDLFHPLEAYPVPIRRNPADELYWLKWDYSFGAAATIRIARLGKEVMATWQHRGSMFNKGRSRCARLRISDWALLEDAVVVANLWLLDETSHQLGCDGATWMMAGRRGFDYHYIRRWSPHDALFDLGRLMFDLVGLEAVRL
jgi:hypothetical protein